MRAPSLAAAEATDASDSNSAKQAIAGKRCFREKGMGIMFVSKGKMVLPGIGMAVGNNRAHNQNQGAEKGRKRQTKEDVQQCVCSVIRNTRNIGNCGPRKSHEQQQDK